MLGAFDNGIGVEVRKGSLFEESSTGMSTLNQTIFLGAKLR